MNPDRLVAIKKQALRSIASRANNPAAPGVSMVAVSPHEALEMVAAIDEKLYAALAKNAGPGDSGSVVAPTARSES